MIRRKQIWRKPRRDIEDVPFARRGVPITCPRATATTQSLARRDVPEVMARRGRETPVWSQTPHGLRTGADDVVGFESSGRDGEAPVG